MPRHAYDHTGRPVYEITRPTGKVVEPNITDMRKLLLLPGVTEVIRERSSPFLVKWRVTQAIMSALTLPRIDGESEDQFAARALEDSEAQAAKARETGSKIHQALEDFLKGQSYDVAFHPHVAATLQCLHAWSGETQGWKAEHGVAHSCGFGTKIDAYHPAGFVVDFKCKDFGPTKKAKVKGVEQEVAVKVGDFVYDEHIEQLAACANALIDMEAQPRGSVKAANIFISTRVPGLVMLHEHEAEDLYWAWRAFEGRLEAWKGQNRYESGFVRE